MTKKQLHTISQSNIKILSKKAISKTVLPSNNIYFNRYPYKVVFDLQFDADRTYREQLLDFKFDLTNFTEEALKYPTRSLMSTQTPSLFIHDYKDLLVTLAYYKDQISEVHGPSSKEHLELLLSNTYRCQAKERLWYGIYDCKVETWLPFRLRTNQHINIGSFNSILTPPEVDEEVVSIINYIKDNVNTHVPKQTGRYISTLYCKFEEFLNILPFVKMSYPKHKMLITKAILSTK